MLSSFLETLEKLNLPAWALLGWCFLVLFTFYPFALSGDLSQVIRHGIFIFGGILSLAYILLTVLYRPILLRARAVFFSLFLVTFISSLSVFWSIRPSDALTGLAFELDTLAVLFSFVAVVLAAAIAFRNWDWKHDLGSYFLHGIGIGFIVPSALLHMAAGSRYYQYAYMNDLSLQILAATFLVAVSYHLDHTNSSRIKNILLYGYAGCAVFICFKASLILVPIMGLGMGLLLIAARLSSETTRAHTPLLAICITSFFLFLIIFSLVHKDQGDNAKYFHDVILIKRSLTNSFQGNAGSYLLGQGPHSFTQYWDTFRSRSSNDGIGWSTDYEAPYLYNQPQYAFGLIPTMIINTGILGLVAWLCFIFFLSHASIRFIWQRALNYDPLVPVALITLCLLYSMILTVPTVQLLALFALSLGVMATRAGNPVGFDVSFISYRVKSVFLAAGILGVTVLLVSSGTILSSSVLFQKGIDQWTVNINRANAIEHTKKLVATRERAEYFRLISEIELDSARRILLDAPALSYEETNTVQTLLSDGVLAASKAAELDPHDYRNWLVLGDFHTFLFMLGAEDAYAPAQSNYNKARELTDYHPVPLYALAELARLKGDTASALEQIEGALHRRPGWEEAIELKESLLQDEQNASADSPPAGS